MDDKQKYWLESKVGYISASRLHELMSASGKFTKVNIDYLYDIQQQRHTKEPAPDIHAEPLEFGTENEQYAVAWLKKNTTYNILWCKTDFETVPFITTNYGFGASPDVYHMDGDNPTVIGEIKCVFGRTNVCRYFSPTLSYNTKRAMVLAEHKDQIVGLFLTHPHIKDVFLLKYNPQNDDSEFDLRSPVDKDRGILFYFKRGEFPLQSYKRRIKFCDDYLKSGKDLESINKEWEELILKTS